MIVGRMRIARCIPKATNTHTEYVILIAFLPQRWLQERASMLRLAYSTLPVLVSLDIFSRLNLFLNKSRAGLGCSFKMQLRVG